MPAALAAAGARFAVADRGDAGQLAAILGDGADLLVDCVCFTAADATALLRWPGTSVMAGTRCCSATTPRPGWAGIPGTRGRRSCWT
jgi:hypothetical protein